MRQSLRCPSSATHLQKLVVLLVSIGAGQGLRPEQDPMILTSIQIALAQHDINVDLLDRTLYARPGPIEVPALMVDDHLVGLAGVGGWSRQGLARSNRLAGLHHTARTTNFKEPARQSLLSLKPGGRTLDDLLADDLLRPIGHRVLSSTGLEIIKTCLAAMVPSVEAYCLEQTTPSAPLRSKRLPRL